jgi:hypothetical protein
VPRRGRRRVARFSAALVNHALDKQAPLNLTRRTRSRERLSYLESSGMLKPRESASTARLEVVKSNDRSGLKDGKGRNYFTPGDVRDSRDRDVNDARHPGKNLINFYRRHRFTTGTNDLFRSPDDAVVALLVAFCQIASSKPAVVERCARVYGVPGSSR